MPAINITVEGLDPLLRNFAQGSTTIKQKVGVALDKGTAILWERLRSYTQGFPRQRESAYIRTHELQRSILQEVSYQQFKGRVYTSLHYAPAVIGEGTQWSMHERMGWWTNESVAREKLPEVVQAFEDANLKVAKALVSHTR